MGFLSSRRPSFFFFRVMGAIGEDLNTTMGILSLVITMNASVKLFHEFSGVTRRGADDS